MQYGGGLTADTRLADHQALRASWARDDVAIYREEISTLGLRNTDQPAIAQALDESLGPLGVIRASPFAYSDTTVTWDLAVNRYGVGLTAAQLAAQLDTANPYLRLQRLDNRAVVSGEGNRSTQRNAVDAVVARDAAARNPLDKFLDGLQGFGITVGALVILGGVLYLYLTTPKRG